MVFCLWFIFLFAVYNEEYSKHRKHLISQSVMHRQFQFLIQRDYVKGCSDFLPYNQPRSKQDVSLVLAVRKRHNLKALIFNS